MLNGFAKKFPDTAYVRENISLIEKEANRLLNEKPCIIPLSAFMKYEKCGDREGYEQLCMSFRKRLLCFLSMALWSKDEKWISAVEDAVWAICDMYTWETPARFEWPIDFSEIRCKMGLFATETALSLCETLYLLEDRLSYIVKERIKKEVRERIIVPYCCDDHDWSIDWGADNWSAVCGGACGMVVMYLGTKAEAEIAVKKSLRCMQVFLSSYKNDGACLEGPIYWEYGYGCFCMFSAMVREFTKGEINLFADEKVKKIAYFGEDIYLDKNLVIPVSDSPHSFNFNRWLFAFLSAEYGVKMPKEEYAVNFGEEKRYRIPFFLRSMFLRDISAASNDDKSEFSIYKDSQWYIKRNGNYILAAKGGCNAEPHNHNDVGSFVIVKKGSFILDDLGWQNYEKGYFGEERYNYICTASLGHSVPIVDSKGQLDGEERRANLLKCDEHEFTLDLSAAYEGDVQIVRSFLPGESELVVKDSFCGKAEKLCERFVTMHKPQIKTDGVWIEDVCISLKSKNKYQCNISETEFIPRPNIVETVEMQKAYFIDFVVYPIEDKTEININIKL